MFKSLLLVALLLLTTVVALPPFNGGSDNTLAPLLSYPNAEHIPDEYIVVFKDAVTDERVSCHHNDVDSLLYEERKMFKRGFMNELISGIQHTYDFEGFRGYSGRFSESVLAKIRQSDDVAFVERNQRVYPSIIQNQSPWGLARISHRERLVQSTFSTYQYDATAGNGVTAYVIDTGVNINHTDFGGRARWGANFSPGQPDQDLGGHGTHVAGTIAGTTYGVAKNAQIVAVKVLGPQGGTNSDVIKGVQWTVADYKKAVDDARRAGKVYKGAVINMSLGGGKSNALDKAVNEAVTAGIVVVVAAGNENSDACLASPSGAEKVITVAASTVEDTRAWFSNWGKCVEIFAPGRDITSDWIGSNTATNRISGTSMASPHVAGLAAYFLGLSAIPLTPKQVLDKIVNTATRNALCEVANSPNLLAYNGFA
ncbi:8634_t:CDS:2 [Paraglomus occultum]|uniref:8634_t:CDS:1 n=1 Tax=Paraglomus occultum TaxID=144539 RepID=A0A9N9D5B1_9GLOM|nr:8634_t:CDS:2 [Paraglomus occultum]